MNTYLDNNDSVIGLEEVETRIALEEINALLRNQIEVIAHWQRKAKSKYPQDLSLAIADLEALVSATKIGNYVIVMKTDAPVVEA